jgi:hypothetical protein
MHQEYRRGNVHSSASPQLRQSTAPEGINSLSQPLTNRHPPTRADQAAFAYTVKAHQPTAPRRADTRTRPAGRFPSAAPMPAAGPAAAARPGAGAGAGAGGPLAQPLAARRRRWLIARQ